MTTPPLSPDQPIPYATLVTALTTLLPNTPMTQIMWVGIEPNSVTWEEWHATEPHRRGHRVPITHPQGAYTEGGDTPPPTTTHETTNEDATS